MAKIVESKTIVGLEVGTTKVVAVVGEVLPDGVVNVLGVGSSPSKGIDKGSITDLSAVVSSIQRAIENAESVADCQIVSVTLAITGEHIQSFNESGFVPIANGEVTQDEIDSAMHTASSVKLPDGLSLLHVIPQEFAVDKQHNIKSPLGLQGVRLKAQAHLIGCQQAWLTNLQKAVESCGLKVDDVVFSGLASTYSVLTEDEKDLGVCMIDFGGGSMDIMVYTNGALRYSKVVPYGGNDITDFVAQSLTTSRNEAESIKINYGSAVNPSQELVEHFAKTKVEVAGLGGTSSRTFTKAQIVDVTSKCYGDLLKVIQNELINLRNDLTVKGIKHDLIAGVVLTGGGAQMDDVAKCATDIFGLHVRVGSPLNITGLTDYVNKPQYATVLGLLQYTHHNDEETKPIFGSVNDEDSILGSIWSKIKKIGNKVRSEF
ncbi:cell division protein FtsA [Bisgaard Taxon 10/6]|uniref:Cell division protein FtsA n=1 Tax=Exercitatus varius TaxID=67857 RepID=A0AAW6QA38_9PAST|nr:cell division protein FtsA [Exercitatus varius]QOF68004.1 cell division protein FtsA [Actinobacillus sp. GY-402]MDG2915887.1 cell division protein FtsA [Exercitatus varius]MDG2918245.1 cell division protein FtsA [Exercitatus varius]MDG2939455.1 cell division protein FtsA [Exercitatus varius]MDG2940989.1 cell division protein FtsA [Exercitatus varius]